MEMKTGRKREGALEVKRFGEDEAIQGTRRRRRDNKQGMTEKEFMRRGQQTNWTSTALEP